MQKIVGFGYENGKSSAWNRGVGIGGVCTLGGWMDWLRAMATVVGKVRRRNAVGEGVWSREIWFRCPTNPV